MPWKPLLYHPLACARWPVWWELQWRYAPLSVRAWPTFVATSAASFASRSGHEKEMERLREAVRPDPPIFIVGHWRSGTTLLHNLLHRSGRFATLRTADAINPLGDNPPDGMVAGGMKSSDRGFDRMVVGPEEPQEEEMALAALCLTSVFHLVYFPRNAAEIFRRAVLFEGMEPGELEAFAKAYKLVAAKTRLVDGTDRTILFKNPASTARLDFLSEVFPGARFIHIVRHPKAVYHSTAALIDGLTERFALQSPKNLERDHRRIEHYRSMMKAHLEQRARLAPCRYTEIRYEELVADPVTGVEKVLGGIGESLEAGERTQLFEYVESLADYKPNRHPDDPETDRMLKRELGFAYETWGYD
ncbi:sulfotransferase family protein [Haloferula sp. A504]|uniref:sulfotransferase family protein n=1 Tax=Haloferula sp. A504 TaxID=3373601 RepID=UPI0031BCE7A0|nr:sulfotransferase [Verrucomicrobiaceae bacterium E54]